MIGKKTSVTAPHYIVKNAVYKKLTLLLVVFCFLGLPNLFSQESEKNTELSEELSFKAWDGPMLRKGSFYVNWGYNRSYYRNTDISFKGKGFDFTIRDVSAHDLPEEFDTKIYFNPTKLTIPQFNFRIGYYLNEKYSVSLGWDHMKYHITDFQAVQIEGNIDPSLSEEYGQEYNGQYINLTPNLLRFEHSDGLNFVRAAIERQDLLWHTKNKKFRIENMLGLSLGAAVPWTDVHFLGVRYPNRIHLSGWGVSALMGVRAHFGNHLYLQYRMQVGYIKMGDILMQDEADSRAKHDVSFTELAVSLGYNFHLKKR